MNLIALSVLGTIIDRFNSLFDAWNNVTSLVDFVSGQQEPTQQILSQLDSIDEDLQQGFANVVQQLKVQEAASQWASYATTIQSMYSVVDNYQLDVGNIDPQSQTIKQDDGETSLDEWSWTTATAATSQFNNFYDACVAGSGTAETGALFDTWVNLVTAAQGGANQGIDGGTVYTASIGLISELLSTVLNLVVVHDYCYQLRAAAGYSLTGVDTYSGETVTLIPMRSDPAVISRLGTVSDTTPSIMLAFATAMATVESDQTNGSVVIGNVPQGETTSVQMSTLGPYPLFLLGSIELSPQDQASRTVITGLRWQTTTTSLEPSGFPAPVLYVQVQTAQVGPDLVLSPMGWVSPPLPATLSTDPVDTTTVVGYGFDWATDIEGFVTALADVPPPPASGNQLPVLTGVGTVCTGGTFSIQVQRGFLDISDLANPVYVSASDSSTWYLPAPGAPIQAVPTGVSGDALPSLANVYLDTSDVCTEFSWPIVNAGLGGTGNLIQLSASTDWPVYRADILQPAKLLAAVASQIVTSPPGGL